MSRLDVVTLLVPREPRWIEYLPLLKLQRATAEKFGHRHLVITEGERPELIDQKILLARMSDSLMHAILEGQIAYLMQWSGEHPVVLVDIDCLVNRDLNAAFDGKFDIGLTNRINELAPINNGAMYIAAGAKRQALKFFTRALALCKDHWGGDQEAIAQAAWPVPAGHVICRHKGARIGFFSMATHNCVPRAEGSEHSRNPFIVHFKGDRKRWMKTYAEKFIL